MRQIVLDTETTGLEHTQGHRIIEIGAVEIVNRRLTGRRYHQYLQPDRDIDAGAIEVHGITPEFLSDKPRFAEIMDDLLTFISDAELIIHNAPFDVGFLDAELRLAGAKCQKIQEYCRITDTLAVARRMHPGQKNSLDALCKRYGIDNSHRDLHGALLDAEILADVYLAMTGGQVAMTLTIAADTPNAGSARTERKLDRSGLPTLVIQYATEEELDAHANRLAAIDKAAGGACVWRKLSD